MLELITDAIQRLGYVGVALVVFLETLIPPIPSEVIMPLVGAAAAAGKLSLPGAIAAATLGSTVGATVWYAAGKAYGEERLLRLAGRHGRWLGLTPKSVGVATAWFARRGALAVFAARFLPGARVYISVPAGVVRMPLPRFVAYTTAGFAIWYGFLAAVGFGGAEFIGAFAIASNVFGVLLLLAAGGLGAKLALTRRRAAPDGN